jgi:dienelactone hydrolase
MPLPWRLNGKGGITMRTVVAVVFALVVVANVSAKDTKSDQGLIDALQKLDVRVFKVDSADANLRSETLRQLREAVNRKDVAAWRNIKTKTDWETFRDEKIAALRKSLGNFPDAPKEVMVVTTKKLRGDGFTVENIIYESRTNCYVTANLYVPAMTDKPMPGFIIVHSHHNPKTQGELQDMGILWARQGCLVLIPDMLGHGERRQHPFVDAKSYAEKFRPDRQDYWFRYNAALQLHLVGESLMGWMVWDLMRGLDVLYQRPNLDKTKVMVFGSVAGGGDPCAVFAALDKRVTAAAPFNFGGPQPETAKLGEDAELAFNYMGGASWESTRNLRLSGRDGFLPWLIVGSIAPRGLIYGHEFAWDEKHDPVWARFQKIWDFYDAKGKLAATAGRGSVKGKPPESTHCNNLGFEHRKSIYPTLKQWFGLPIPEENKKRFDSSELQCWTDEARKTLKPKMLNELALKGEVIVGSGDPVHEVASVIAWLKALGSPTLPKENCVIERVPAELPNPMGNFRMEKIVVRHAGDPNLAVSAVILRPLGKIKITSVVIGIAQDGKAGFLKHRAETIAELLKNNVAISLPDLRGTGETSAEGRGRQSGGTSYSGALQMHGQTVPGVQLQDLSAVMSALPQLGFKSIALWGDSFAEPNDPTMNFAVPYDVAKMPRQSEPMGGLLALLGGAFGGDRIKGVYVRGGLISMRSVLDSPFCYFPHDAVVPSILAPLSMNQVYDFEMLVQTNAKRGLRMEALVDGLNRRADQRTLAKAYETVAKSRRANDLLLREEPSSPAEVAAWLSTHLKK